MATNRRKAGAAAITAAALLSLPTNTDAKALERFYGSLGASLSTYGGGDQAVQSSSWRNLNASIGRYFSARNQVSLDFWLNQSSTSTDSEALPYSLEHRYDSLSLSLNAHRTLWRQGRFSITGGFGVGIEQGTQRQKHRFRNLDTEIETKHDHRRFQHNLSSNAHWQITNRLSLSAGYRISWTDLEEGTARRSMLNLTLRMNASKID